MSIRMNKSKPNTVLSQLLAPQLFMVKAEFAFLFRFSSVSLNSLLRLKLTGKKLTLGTTMMHISTTYVRLFPATIPYFISFRFYSS